MLKQMQQQAKSAIQQQGQQRAAQTQTSIEDANAANADDQAQFSG